jgi:hypothetical protein
MPANVGGGREVQNYLVRFVLRNVGPVSARSPYVLIKKHSGGTPVQVVTLARTALGGDQIGLTQLDLPNGTMFAGDATLLIHPELEFPAFDYQIETVRERAEPFHHHGVAVATSGILLECGFGSEHSRMLTKTFEWSHERFSQLLMGRA